MPKLDFAQAKSNFKTDEAVFSYFILVESYKKHLNENHQKEKFLNPDKIDDMFKVLSDQQLEHLQSLLRVFVANRKFLGNIPLRGSDDRYGGDGLSEWFVSNLYDNSSVKKTNDPGYCHNFAKEVGKDLIKKITKFADDSGKSKKRIEDIIDKYKSNLRKFRGNSVAYRQWLILLTTDHGIPYIEKTYDITKLLKKLDFRYLVDLYDMIKKTKISSIITAIKYLEP